MTSVRIYKLFDVFAPLSSSKLLDSKMPKILNPTFILKPIVMRL